MENETIMSYSEILQLRNTGHIIEAYTAAKQLFISDDENINNARLFALLANELVVYHVGQSDLDLCLSVIRDFVLLSSIPSQEVGIYNHMANSVRVFAQKLNERPNPNLTKMDQCFDCIKTIPLYHAGIGFSILVSTIFKIKSWSRLNEFAYWCGWEHLRDEDFEPFITQQNTKIMALAEQIAIKMAKYLLEKNNQEDILSFIPKLQELSKNYPKYTYPPYFLAKLYIAIDQQDQAHEVLLPFVQKKSRDFWVWQLMAEIQYETEKKVMYYAKALDCGSRKEDMLVALYEEAAGYFVQAEYYSMAKWMIEHALQIRKRNNWRISPELQYITRQAWFMNTTSSRESQYIKEQASMAEVEALGRVKMKPNRNHKPTAQNEEVSFEGTLKRNSAGFGFIKDKIIGDVFIPQSIILNHQNGETICGKAIKRFDKKKQQWGYAAIKIN